jgi:putative ABC transport system permease protein
MRRFDRGALMRRFGGDPLREAWATIRGNPLRAGLAVFAVAAAVATMTIVITALEGVARSARESSARTFGSDSFVIARLFPGQSDRRQIAEKLARNPVIRRSDVRFLDRHASGAVVYAPSAQRAATVSAGSRRFERAVIVGTSASLAEIRALPIARGRFLAEPDDQTAALVAVIGADVADELFPDRDPLGQTLRLGGRGFRVIGLHAREGAAGGAALDRTIWIPLTAFERTLGPSDSLQVFARGVPASEYQQAEDRARTTLRARRHIQPGVEDTFDLITPEAARSFVAALSQRVSAAALPISFMALLAAVVVVTNTMLVSVTERTRDIGVRRAVGASRRDVILEVLAESALIGLAGGLAGVALAAGVLALASRATGFPLPVATATIAWSLGAACGAGILAGWYPARRAARLDVIAAVRQE